MELQKYAHVQVSLLSLNHIILNSLDDQDVKFS